MRPGAMRREGRGRTSIAPKASCLDPFGCDIGARSCDLDPLTPIVANGGPHCFGFLINGNDVRYSPHVDSALVGLPGHLNWRSCRSYCRRISAALSLPQFP